MCAMRPTWVYILLCADGRYYTGTYRGEDIETRVDEHNLGVYPKAYTRKRRPVKLVWAGQFQWAIDAIEAERSIKGWSRAKKEALIRGDYEALPGLSKRGPAKDRR